MLIILHSNSVLNLLLFSFDGLELTSVPIVDTELIALDIVYRSRSHVIEDASVLVLDKFLSGTQVLMVIHLFILKVVHILYKLVPSLHVFDPFLSLLFLLL